MSERNQVYKEIEQLEERLSTSQKRADSSQQQSKSMADELETLRREIKSALQDRDHAMKEVRKMVVLGDRMTMIVVRNHRIRQQNKSATTSVSGLPLIEVFFFFDAFVCHTARR